MISTERQQWLEALQPGDEVVINGRPLSLAVVTRRTAKQVIVKDRNSERRFWVSTGMEVSALRHSLYAFTRLEPKNDKNTRQILIENSRSRLRGLDVNKLDDDTTIELAEAFQKIMRRSEGET